MRECPCPQPGWCPRFLRIVSPPEHPICAGQHGAELQALAHAQWTEELPKKRLEYERFVAVNNPAVLDRLGDHLFRGKPLAVPLNDPSAVSETPARIPPNPELVKLAMTCAHRRLKKGKHCAKCITCGEDGERPGEDVSVADCVACQTRLHPELAPPAAMGNLGDGYHLADHLGLSFGARVPTALYTAEGATLDYRDRFKGLTGVFLGGGPSLKDFDLSRLDRPGLLTLAVNGVGHLYRPHVWVGCDDPASVPAAATFNPAVWHDPGVLKVVPRGIADSPLDGADGPAVRAMPNTVYCLRRSGFRADSFLTERAFCWGNESADGGGRSVMLVALKLLWYLGVRDVLLLGCDFKMNASRPYAHDEPKDERAAASNNRTYQLLNERFAALRPVFDAASFRVRNATPDSGLTAFDRVRWEDAAC